MGTLADNSEDENDENVKKDLSDSCKDDPCEKTISNFSSLAQLGKRSK